MGVELRRTLRHLDLRSIVYLSTEIIVSNSFERDAPAGPTYVGLPEETVIARRKYVVRRIGQFSAAFALAAVSLISVAGRADAADFSYAFQCQIPRYGYGSCVGDRANVPAGHYVRVKNVSSGGKDIRFRLHNTAGNHLLATSTLASPGEIVFVWRNDTGRTINVEFTADAAGWTTVTSNARAHVTRR